MRRSTHAPSPVVTGLKTKRKRTINRNQDVIYACLINRTLQQRSPSDISKGLNGETLCIKMSLQTKALTFAVELRAAYRPAERYKEMQKCVWINFRVQAAVWRVELFWCRCVVVAMFTTCNDDCTSLRLPFSANLWFPIKVCSSPWIVSRLHPEFRLNRCCNNFPSKGKSLVKIMQIAAQQFKLFLVRRSTPTPTKAGRDWINNFSAVFYVKNE